MFAGGKYIFSLLEPKELPYIHVFPFLQSIGRNHSVLLYARENSRISDEILIWRIYKELLKHVHFG